MTETFSRPTIAAARLTLRPPRAGDAGRLAALANDYDVVRMTGSMPFPFGPENAEAFLSSLPGRDPRTNAIYAIDLTGEGFIGILGFHAGSRLGPELGYWLGRPYWGRGLATEAAKAGLAWAHGDWGKPVIVAGHNTYNDASGQVLTKVGFLYTGEVKMLPSAARGGLAPVRMMVRLA